MWQHHTVFAELSAAHDETLLVHNIPKVLYWLQIWWMWRRPFEQLWTHCHVQWHDALCCCKQESEDGSVVINGWAWSAIIIRRWHLNNAPLGLMGLKCAKKISLTPLHHQQPEVLIHSIMDTCFHVVYSDTITWMSQQRSLKLRSLIFKLVQDF